MKGWVQDVMKMSWKKRLQREAKTNFSAELTAVRDEYDKKIERLTQERDTLDSRLQLVLAERARYAEEMKHALLRGVCALNIETMSVFGQQGKGDENLPQFQSNPALHDPLPFPPSSASQTDLRMPTLNKGHHMESNTVPLGDATNRSSTVSPHRQLQQQQQEGVLPHRHLSDYADLHQPPPPPASLVRHPHPGSLHIADQYPVDAAGFGHVQDLPAPLSASVPSYASPMRSRSPDHRHHLHNFKTAPSPAPVTPAHQAKFKPRQMPVGRVVRPALDTALKGPIGMVTVRDSGAKTGTTPRPKPVRVERHH